jgi:hypothetical protein
MVSRIRLKTLDGQPIEFVDQIIGSGAMKDVYFSPDRSLRSFAKSRISRPRTG